MLRLNNEINPSWPSDFFPGNIVNIRLGTWDRVEYGAATVGSHTDEPPVPCFVKGAMIRTDRGDVAVEALQPGDLILTADHGAQPLRWIGRRTISRGLLAVYPQFRPIRIAAGALGPSVPDADLLVSPQHRVLVRSSIARRMFGSAEVLVAAKHLCSLDGIEQVSDLPEVTYFHLLFDRHEVIVANGSLAESLFVGPEAVKALGDEASQEVLGLFPELAEPQAGMPSARPQVSGRLGRKLAQRHRQNDKPVQSLATEPA